MKNWILSIGLLWSFLGLSQTPCDNGMAGDYPCLNMDLLSHMTNAEIGGCDNTNDIWGWVSPNTGKEYAIVGCSNGTAFVDVSNPVSPIYLGLLPAFDAASLWRDMETYHDFVFVVSESSNHGLQIMNLLQLDTLTNFPTTFSEDAHYDGFGHCHTLNIDPVSGMLCAMGTNTFNGGPHLVGISDPLNPVFLGGYAESGYTHDGYITTYSGPDASHQGQVIISLCNGYTGLFVVNATDPNDIQLLDSYLYPQTGYVHQGWFTKDKRYFLVNDELDEMNFGNHTRTHLFDLNDLDNITYMGFHESQNTSIDHNLYMVDQFAFESNYRSGVRVLDAIRTSEGLLNEVAYFDLFPLNDLVQFSGTWSNYQYLPSGINLATSMYDGFFITRPTFLKWNKNQHDVCLKGSFDAQLQVNTNLYFPLQVSIDNPSWLLWEGPSVVETTGNYSFHFSVTANAPSGQYRLPVDLIAPNGQRYTVEVQMEISGNTAPVSPTLLTPSEFEVVGFNPVYFAWSPSADAVDYQITIATDPDFTQNVLLQTTPSMAIGIPLNTSGLHYWKVVARNECGDSWKDQGTFYLMSTGIAEMNLQQADWQVYPNPAQDDITIENVHEQVRIMDVIGHVVFQFSQSSEKMKINTSAWSNGVYFIQNGEEVRPLLIRH
jgi:choice-of-anchor B domain-containing protein